MFDNKFLITLLGLVVAVVAINNFKSKDEEEVQEDFFMNPSMTWKVDRVAATPSSAKKGDFFSVPGTYQAMLNPRFSNVDYGANIRYNMPSQDNLAAPCNPLGYASNPLTFASMVNSQERQSGVSKENFAQRTDPVRENYGCQSCGGGCSVADCRKGGAPLGYHGGAPVIPGNGYANGNFNKVSEEVYSDKKAGGSSYDKRQTMYCDGNDKQSLSSSLPVRDMTAMNASGDNVQPIVYDRYIYANRNSRLRCQGDWIRGDLPIMPCNTGWFQVSVQPNIDLNQGAMNVMGGINNETSKGLADIIYKTSGNAETAIAGVDMSNHVNMSTMFGGGLTAGQGDVNVTSFP